MMRIIFVIVLTVAFAACTSSDRGKAAKGQTDTIAADSAKSNDVQEASGKANHAPAVTAIDITPEIAKIGDTLTVNPTASDPDGDAVTFTYQWFKNDVQLPEPSNSLSLTGDFKRGDRITVTAVPDDGTDKGKPGKVLLTIANSSPEITSSASDISIANRQFTYQVRAVDKDKDPLNYILKSAPNGMTINSSTGLIQWNVPPDFRGKASVTVSVTDGQGGEAVQSFAFEIAAANPAEK